MYPFEPVMYKGAWHIFDNISCVYYRAYGGAIKAHAKAKMLNESMKEDNGKIAKVE